MRNANKLNGLTLDTAELLKEALSLYQAEYHCLGETKENIEYLLSQLNSIVEYLKENKS